MTLDKDQAQSIVIERYFELGLRKSTAVLSTGFGKSKVAIEIIKRLDPKKVLILVNSTPLRDFNWREEFENWGEEALFYEKVELVTYQTAYKWTKDEFNLSEHFIIADEVDFAASTEELARFFYEYEDCHILGLTGFITEAKKAWFETHLPVFTEFNQSQAQSTKLLNNIHYIFVQYDLSTNPNDITVQYSKHGERKTFTQSENRAYDYHNKKVQYLIIESQRANTEFMLGQITYHEKISREKSYDYKIRRAVAERNNVLLHSKASAEITKKLLEYIKTTYPDDKTIVFSKRTQQSINICGEDQVYNGQIAKKKADLNYQQFRDGDIKVLGVCDKINRGVNINNLRIAIFESFFGSDTKATQRFGRLMRLAPDQHAIAFILLPYYMRKEKNNTFTLQETQQVKWARNMLRSTDVKSSTVWNYCAVKPKNND